MFGRRRRKDSTEAITEFWVWWSHARPRVAAAIEDGTTEKLADEISDQVHAIHDKLQWELSKGTRSRHSLSFAPRLKSIGAAYQQQCQLAMSQPWPSSRARSRW